MLGVSGDSKVTHRLLWICNAAMVLALGCAPAGGVVVEERPVVHDTQCCDVDATEPSLQPHGSQSDGRDSSPSEVAPPVEEREACADVPGAAPICLVVLSPGSLSGVARFEIRSSDLLAGTAYRRAVFSLDGTYLLTDVSLPYAFDLPTTRLRNGRRTLLAEVHRRSGGGHIKIQLPIDIQNAERDVTQPSGERRSSGVFAPYEPMGDIVEAVAVGDAAGGRQEADRVLAAARATDPDLFLYLGDVYERGTITEFHNWYGTATSRFGAFADITNPVIGNHEYLTDDAAGYFDYWGSGSDTYQYTAGGWQIVALDSNERRALEPGGTTYEWLRDTLEASTNICLMVQLHHPRFSIGPQGDTERLDPVWRLMAEHDVDVVLAGHDHNYQRWQPLDEDAMPDEHGITQFVVGSSGFGIRPFVRSDSRVAIGLDDPASDVGMLQLRLRGGSMDFSYVDLDDQVRDRGVVTCER